MKEFIFGLLCVFLVVCIVTLTDKAVTYEDLWHKAKGELEVQEEINTHLLQDNKRIVGDYGRDVSACMGKLREISGKNYMFTGIGSNELFIDKDEK